MEFKKEINEKYKGSLTIEAAFIVPMVTCVMIFLSILLYSRCYAQIIVDNCLNRVSSSWYGVEDRLAVDNNVAGRAESIGYVLSQITTSTTNEARKQRLKEEITNSIEHGSPMKVNVDVDLDAQSSIFSETVNVSVTCKYKLPMKGIFGIFQVGDSEGNIEEVIKRNITVASSEGQSRAYSFTKKKLIGLFKTVVGEDAIEKFNDSIEVIKDGFDQFID